MNSLWQSQEMAFALNDSGSKVLIADEERVARYAEIPRSNRHGSGVSRNSEVE